MRGGLGGGQHRMCSHHILGHTDIIGGRIHHFSMILHEKQHCSHKAIDFGMHSEASKQFKLKSLNPTVWQHVACSHQYILFLFFFGLLLSNEGEVCFVYQSLSPCLVNSFNSNQALGGEINCKSNGERAGLDLVRFSSYHVQ